jgi:hypothetical protein
MADDCPHTGYKRPVRPGRASAPDRARALNEGFTHKGDLDLTFDVGHIGEYVFQLARSALA